MTIELSSLHERQLVSIFFCWIVTFGKGGQRPNLRELQCTSLRKFQPAASAKKKNRIISITPLNLKTFENSSGFAVHAHVNLRCAPKNKKNINNGVCV